MNKKKYRTTLRCFCRSTERKDNYRRGITFTAGRLPGGDMEHLGGHPHRTLNRELLVLGTPHQIRAHCHTHRKEDSSRRPNRALNLQESKRDCKEGALPFSRFLTFLDERVIRMRCSCSWGSSSPGFVGFIPYAILEGETAGSRSHLSLFLSPAPTLLAGVGGVRVYWSWYIRSFWNWILSNPLGGFKSSNLNRPLNPPWHLNHPSKRNPKDPSLPMNCIVVFVVLLRSFFIK